MAKYSYLFDASALVAFLLKNPVGDAKTAKAKLTKFLALKSRSAELLVPNICMAETSSALAKFFLAEGHSEKAEKEYRQHIEALLDLVSSSRKHIFQTYPLARAHLEDIEDIFIADRSLPARKGSPLSGHDGIIISMGRLLERSRGKGLVIILTLDARMADVCSHRRVDFPHAIDLARHEIPGI